MQLQKFKKLWIMLRVYILSGIVYNVSMALFIETSLWTCQNVPKLCHCQPDASIGPVMVQFGHIMTCLQGFYGKKN